MMGDEILAIMRLEAEAKHRNKRIDSLRREVIDLTMKVAKLERAADRQVCDECGCALECPKCDPCPCMEREE